MKYQILFSRGIRINVFNLSSAKVAESLLSVNVGSQRLAFLCGLTYSQIEINSCASTSSENIHAIFIIINQLFKTRVLCLNSQD